MVTHRPAKSRLLVKGYARSSRASVAYSPLAYLAAHAALTRNEVVRVYYGLLFEVIILETKICSKCGIEKPITEYHKNGFDR